MKTSNAATSRSVSTAIGEYFVLGELLKRNVEAYLAHGATQKSWDVVIFTGHSTKRVQVKTIDWPTQKAVNGTFSGFDYLVVVLLDRNNPRSRFFIFAHPELDALLSSPIERRGDKRTLTMSHIALTSRFSSHEDNWDILIPPTQAGQDVLEPISV
jgi:hypothetical protein